jgi:hypothetical protein
VPDRITIRDQAENGYAVLSGSGLEPPSILELRLRLDKALYNFGTVLIDLSDLPLLTPVWAITLAAALGRHGGWPSARIGLFAVDPESALVLDRTGIGRLVPHWDTEAEAAAGLRHRPPLARWSASLGRDASAPARARAMVTDASLVWSIPAATRLAAVLVASELVTNVVKHAATQALMVVEAGRTSLTVRVRDYSGGEPVPRRDFDAEVSRGGLAVVAATARFWGVNQHVDGKTVWARLSLPGPDRSKGLRGGAG